MLSPRSAIVAGGLAVVFVVAQTPGFHSITQPSASSDIQAGTTFTIEWSVAEEFVGQGECILSLIGGPDGNSLEAVESIGRHGKVGAWYGREEPGLNFCWIRNYRLRLRIFRLGRSSRPRLAERIRPHDRTGIRHQHLPILDAVFH